MKRLPWSVTCLSPMRQGELLATQNPDGSLVFSAVLKDEQGLLFFLLVPPSPSNALPRRPSGRRRFPALGIPPAGRSTSCILTPMETERRCSGVDCNSLALVHILVIHTSVKLRSPPTRTKPG